MVVVVSVTAPVFTIKMNNHSLPGWGSTELTLLVDVHSIYSSTSEVGITLAFLMTLALISLLFCRRGCVATPAIRVGLQPKVGVLLAELPAPGRVNQ